MQKKPQSKEVVSNLTDEELDDNFIATNVYKQPQLNESLVKKADQSTAYMHVMQSMLKLDTDNKQGLNNSL